MTQRGHYDDKFRASAVVMLKAAGYPDNKYKLQEIADHLRVPSRTLRRWFNGENGAPPVVPSYLKTYIDDGEPSDTYPELKGLRAASVGTSPILIDPDSRQFHVTFASGGTGAGSRRIGFVDELAATG